MTREEKTKAISELTEKLGASTHLYLTDISGLDAQATSNLRRACYKANISLSMTKNTFLDKAMQASDKDFGDLSTILKGNTSIMFSEFPDVDKTTTISFFLYNPAKLLVKIFLNP